MTPFYLWLAKTQVERHAWWERHDLKVYIFGWMLIISSMVGGVYVIVAAGIHGWQKEIARVEYLEAENAILRIRIDQLQPLSLPLKVPLVKKPKCIKHRVSGRCSKWSKLNSQ